MSPFVSESDSKFSIWSAPIGCFETPTKRLSNFEIKYSKTVQNTSVTILDHQKSIIAKKISYFFGECEKQLFPKNVRLYKNLEKYNIRYQLFMVILSKMGLGGHMALLDYSNKETLLINLRGSKNVYQKSDRYVHGHDPKVSKTGLTLSLSILIASRNATILLVQIGHRIISFCSNVSSTICNNIVEDNSLIKKFGNISWREDVFGRR